MEEIKSTAEVVTTPVEATKTAPATEVTQYELPDGTKTDAEGLSKAWRDNFMPEYTRKSQELAAIKSKQEVKTEQPVQPAPWEDPEWQPEDYKQLGTLTAEQAAAMAEQRVWQRILDESERETREQQERDSYIEQETNQLKAIDPKVDVNRVMSHASKFGFASLIPAHQNMKAMDEAARIAEERVLKNMQARSSAPIGLPTGGGASASFPADVRSGIDKARYILRNQK